MYFDKDDPVTMFRVPRNTLQVPCNALESSLDLRMHNIDHGLDVSKFKINVYIQEGSSNHSEYTGDNNIDFVFEEDKNQNYQSSEYESGPVSSTENELNLDSKMVSIHSSEHAGSKRLSSRS